jgi:hypothetical protein
MNDIVYIDHMKIAEVPASPSSREANVRFRNSSHRAKNIYARADNNNPPGVAHNRNRYWRLYTMTITE